MLLKSRQIMEGVDPVEGARVNETHEQIADVSPMLGLEEQRIFSMKYGPFEGPFADVVVQWCPRNSQEQGQRFPMF